MNSRLNCITGRRIFAVMVAIMGLLGTLPLMLGASSVSAQSIVSAQFRVVHTVFDAPAVDVYLNGNKAAGGIAFKDIGPRVAVYPGSYTVRVTPAGKSNSLIDSTLNLEAGKSYSFVALGRMADLTTRVLQDDLSPLEPGQTRLRLMHTSPDTPTVDAAIKDGSVLYPNLGLGEVSNYFPLSSGPINVEVRPAGTTVVALSVPSLTLQAGTAYTAYVVGLSGGSPGLSTLVEADPVAARISEVLPLTGPAAVSSAPASPLPKTGAAGNGSGRLPTAYFALALLATISMVAGASILVKLHNRR